MGRGVDGGHHDKCQAEEDNEKEKMPVGYRFSIGGLKTIKRPIGEKIGGDCAQCIENGKFQGCQSPVCYRVVWPGIVRYALQGASRFLNRWRHAAMALVDLEPVWRQFVCQHWR